jgi:hypothetical protein
VAVTWPSIENQPSVLGVRRRKASYPAEWWPARLF